MLVFLLEVPILAAMGLGQFNWCCPAGPTISKTYWSSSSSIYPILLSHQWHNEQVEMDCFETIFKTYCYIIRYFLVASVDDKLVFINRPR